MNFNFHNEKASFAAFLVSIAEQRRKYKSQGHPFLSLIGSLTAIKHSMS